MSKSGTIEFVFIKKKHHVPYNTENVNTLIAKPFITKYIIHIHITYIFIYYT